MIGAAAARMLALRLVLVALCLGVQVRDAAAFNIGAGAPGMTQTGASTFSVEDAAANAISSASRTWATDGVVLSATDSATMAGLGGEMAVTVTEGAAADAAVGAVVACVASVVCAAAVATVAAVAVAYRMKAHGDGTVDADPGAPQVSVPGVLWNYSTCTNKSSPSEAAACGGAQVTGCSLNSAMDSTCTIKFAGDNATYYAFPAGHAASVMQCPDGVSSPGGDGLCATGNYATQTPVAVAQALKKAGVGLASPGIAQAAQDAVSIGGQTMPAIKVQVTGPATQTGPQTVTQTSSKTDAQGNTVTSTQTVSPTYSYTYNPDGTVSVKTQTTTSTTSSDGTSSAVTTAPATGTAGAGSGTGTDTPTPGLCDEYPGIIACTKLGDPPTDVVPTGNVNVPSYAPEEVDLPVGCPAPSVVQGKAFSYQPLCDAATQAKPWVLVGAAFTALLMVVAAIRTM